MKTSSSTDFLTLTTLHGCHMPMQFSFVQCFISTFSTLKSLLLLMSSGKVHFQGRFVCSLIVAGLTCQMGRFSVYHLDVTIQSMLVNSIVFTHVTIEGRICRRQILVETPFRGVSQCVFSVLTHGRFCNHSGHTRRALLCRGLLECACQEHSCGNSCIHTCTQINVQIEFKSVVTKYL